MTKIVMRWVLCVLGVLASSVSAAETTEERLERLEKTLAEMTSKTYSRQGTLQSYLAESLYLGGFFENSITSIWGPDTPSQVVADSHRLGLNISADLHPRFRLVTQTSFGFSYAFRNEHNNPNHGSSIIPLQRAFDDVTFGSLLSQAFGEYDLGSKLKIQMGMGFTPFGRAYQVRDPVLFLKRRGPQIIRTSGVNRVVIADPFWKGFNILGSFDDKQQYQYNLYTTSPLDHSGKLGGGARFSWNPNSHLTMGASTQNGHQMDKSFLSYGGDISWTGKCFGIYAEWARLESDFGDNESYYAQVFVKTFEQSLVFFIDSDYLKNSLGQTTVGSAAVNDPYIKREHTVGVNYYFYPNIKVRLDLIFHDYIGDRAVVSGQNRDYYSGSLSSGISF